MTRIFIFTALALIFTPPAFAAKKYVEGSQETAVKEFLENLNSDEAASYGENSSEVGRAVGDLNGDGAPEVALVWLTMGPTYWRNNLTIFTPAGSGEYTLMDTDSTISLVGEAKAPTIENGVVLIDQVVYGEGEPICCPTVPKQGRYKWTDRKLSEIEQD